MTKASVAIDGSKFKAVSNRVGHFTRFSEPFYRFLRRPVFGSTIAKIAIVQNHSHGCERLYLIILVIPYNVRHKDTIR